jgi:hypothetical protein
VSMLYWDLISQTPLEGKLNPHSTWLCCTGWKGHTMLFELDVAGAMATIRTKPPVFAGRTSEVTLKAFTQLTLVFEADSTHEFPDAAPETTVADPELSLKSKERTTLVTEKLSALEGATYIPKLAATKKTAKSARRMQQMLAESPRSIADNVRYVKLVRNHPNRTPQRRYPPFGRAPSGEVLGRQKNVQ